MDLPTIPQNNSITIFKNFNCKHCEQEYLSETFNAAIKLYGVFFLVGDNCNYIGTTCINCKKTIYLTDEGDLINLIKEKLSSYLNLPNGNAVTPNFRYFSPVESHPLLKDKIESGEIITYGQTLAGGQPSQDTLDIIYNEIQQIGIDNPEIFQTHLCSYILDWLSPMGCYLSILWIKTEIVENIIDAENETKTRIIPRYIDYDPLIDSADHFSWHNYRILDHLKKVGIPFEIANPDHPRNSLIQNLDFLRLIDDATRPGMNQSHISTSTASVIIYPDEKTSDAQIDQGSKKDTSKNVKENISKKVWGAFRNESTQKLLYAMSMEFIFDYMKGVQNLDFSAGDIKRFGEKYMMRLYGAVKSSRKRKHETAKTTKKLIEQLHNEAPAFQKIITRNNDLIELMLTVAKFAKEEQIVINILILGETGTGKELFAKAIHESSGRKGKFIPQNCGAIPDTLFESEFFGLRKEAGVGTKIDKKGFFEEAESGTIFLDEIGELAQHHQSKILRVLQEREIQPVGGTAKKINVKIVCATNKDLEAEVINGKFREDLLGRFNYTFTIPPLKERKNDIPLLVNHFIKKYDLDRKSNPDLPPISISDECLERFQEYDWDKNVRELEHVITAVMIDMGSERRIITPDDLNRLGFKLQKSTHHVPQKQKSQPQKRYYTDEEIIECLLRNENNKSNAAKELGMDIRSVRRRCKKLDPPS